VESLIKFEKKSQQIKFHLHLVKIFVIYVSVLSNLLKAHIKYYVGVIAQLGARIKNVRWTIFTASGEVLLKSKCSESKRNDFTKRVTEQLRLYFDIMLGL